MSRTIIDIPDELIRESDRLCKTLGISRAEAVRRGLREFVAHNASVRTDGFGLWHEHGSARDPWRQRLKALW